MELSLRDVTHTLRLSSPGVEPFAPQPGHAAAGGGADARAAPPQRCRRNRPRNVFLLVLANVSSAGVEASEPPEGTPSITEVAAKWKSRSTLGRLASYDIPVTGGRRTPRGGLTEAHHGGGRAGSASAGGTRPELGRFLGHRSYFHAQRSRSMATARMEGEDEKEQEGPAAPRWAADGAHGQAARQSRSRAHAVQLSGSPPRGREASPPPPGPSLPNHPPRAETPAPAGQHLLSYLSLRLRVPRLSSWGLGAS